MIRLDNIIIVKFFCFNTSFDKCYISEKLKGAGCNQTIFEDAAIEAILNAADGTPRLINKFCNASMLIGDSHKANLITTDIVMQAINDCELG